MNIFDITKNKNVKLHNINDVIYYIHDNISYLTTKTDIQLISQYVDLIPLYDINTDKIYIVNKNDVYKYVIEKHYRLAKINNFDKDNRWYIFMKNYDENILNISYIKAFYYYFDKIISNIVRKSYYGNISDYTITPYYNSDELEKIRLNNFSLDNISAKLIFQHQKHLYAYKYFIKYYTFFGYININKYTRGFTKYKNDDIEYFINKLQKIIITAPIIKDNYTLYRFIYDDKYLSELAIGDIYVDNSFISTTHYELYNVNYNFELALIKINIKKNAQDIHFLCIETESIFAYEQEILLPIGSKLKLINKSGNFAYHHTNKAFEKKMKKIYEFDYIGITGKIRNNYDKYDIVPDNNYNFNEISFDDNISNIDQKLYQFNNTYVNKGGIIYINGIKFYCMYVNSLLPEYRNKFLFERENNYVMYVMDKNNGYIKLLMEINNIISVNYIFTKIDSDGVLYGSDDNNRKNGYICDDLMTIAKISYIFQCNICIIHPYYVTANYYNKQHNHESYTKIINKDIHEYLIHKKKRFNDKNIIAEFKYHILDELRDIKCSDIISKQDYDDLHYIYEQSKTINFIDFYTYLLKLYPPKLGLLIDKLNKIYDANPFYNNYYVFDTFQYLFNRDIISSLPNIRYFDVKKYIERKEIIYEYRIKDIVV